MKELICIVCPNGCHLTIDESNKVTGNLCKRGEAYAISETTHPTRVVTSTVRTVSSTTPRISVKTEKPIPKELMFDLIKLLDDVCLNNDLPIGSVVLNNVFDTGINVITTKEFKI
jgi:CxxC motif-containing protein